VRVWFRLLVVNTMVAACLISMGDVAVAQVQLPVVRISYTKSPALFINSCVSPPHVSLSARGQIVLSRNGPTDQKLAVTYRVTGPAEPTSGTAVFAARSGTVNIELVPVTSEPSVAQHIDVSVLAGSGYSLANPSHASIQVVRIVADCATVSTSTSTTLVRLHQLPHTGAGHTSVLLFSGLFALMLGAALAIVRREHAHSGPPSLRSEVR
jgi:LPXTG-motif cell wall-anchored protein